MKHVFLPYARQLHLSVTSEVDGTISCQVIVIAWLIPDTELALRGLAGRKPRRGGLRYQALTRSIPQQR